MIILSHISPFSRFAFFLISGLILSIPPMSWAESNRLELVGAYRYTYHDPIGLVEAKKIACTEATRLSIDSSRFFIDATSSVIDSQALRDLVQKIASGYVKDAQILEQSEKGRTVYCKVKGYLDPEEVKVMILTELHRGPTNETLGIDQNRTLKIVSVAENKGGAVVVVYKALKRLDWISTAYDGSLRESADVMIDFYDERGIPLSTIRHAARIKPDGTDVMNPGEISTHTFVKPAGTKSYRVWLVK